MKYSTLFWILLLGVVCLTAAGCSKESEEPHMSMGEYGQALAAEGEAQHEQDSSDKSRIYPFGQSMVVMQNYALYDYQAFVTCSAVDPYNPSIDDLLNAIPRFVSGGLVGVPLNFTQMVLPGLDLNASVYSDGDAEYPVILVSAWGGKMMVRCLQDDGLENFKTIVYCLKLPEENGGFRPMTSVETEFFGYAHMEDGDWQTLYFPENHSDDFRVVCMTIGCEYDFKGTHHTLPSRTWFFVQLPWTDDEEVFDRVPLYSNMDDIAK